MRDDDQRTLALSVVVLAAGTALLVGGMVLAGAGPWGSAQPTPTPSTPAPSTATASGTGTPPGETPEPTTGTPEPTTSGDETSNATATSAGLPDGGPLAGTRPLADAEVTIEGVDDEFGFATAAGDVNGDGVPDVVVGAPFHNATGQRSGAVFVFFGPLEAGNVTAADADVTLSGENRGDWAGNGVSVADVNADGTGDLVVGAPRTDATEENAGTVYVVHGGADLGGEVPLGSADVSVTGTAADGLAGYSVTAANVTGDGAADLVVAAPRVGDERGEVYVVDGADLEQNASFGDADATFVGEGVGDEAGWSVAVGENVTGEGPDVVVGARRNAAADETAGAAYVVDSPFEGRTPLGDAALVLRGEAGAFAGWSVATPGDVDGDGRTDVAVGAPLAGSGGVVYLADGGTGERSLAEADAVPSASGGHRAGWIVADAGDVTCDGTPDLLVGAPEHDAGGDNAGAIHVLADANVTDLGNATATLVGTGPGAQAGRMNDVGVIRGENATGLVVAAAFGPPPQTTHLVVAACPGE